MIRFGAVPLAVLLLAPWGAGAEDWAQLQKQGILRVVVWSGAPPELFALKPGGEPGFEREILESFAGLHRLKLETVTVDQIAGRLPALASGKGHVVAGGLAATDSRRELVSLSAEVFPITYMAVSLAPHRVESIEQLRRERVGTVRQSSWAEQIAAAGVPPANVDDSYANIAELLAALHAKKVSAMVLSVRVAMLERKRDPTLEFGTFLGAPSSGCFAVAKDQPELLAALNEYILNVRRTPTWNRLVVKYFGEDALEVLRKSQGKRD